MMTIVRDRCRRWMLAAVLIVLSGCGGSTGSYDGPSLSYLGPDAVVLAFGDSLTYGTGAARSAAYPSQLAARIDRRVINAGVPGETTSEGRRRLGEWLSRVEPDLVLLCLGGNDMLRRQSQETMRDNLRAMVRHIQEQGAEVVLIAVPKLHAWSLEPHPAYSELGHELDVPVLTDALAEILSDRALKSDAIHPNAEGYGQLAEATRRLLLGAGALDTSVAWRADRTRYDPGFGAQRHGSPTVTR